MPGTTLPISIAALVIGVAGVGCGTNAVGAGSLDADAGDDGVDAAEEATPLTFCATLGGLVDASDVPEVGFIQRCAAPFTCQLERHFQAVGNTEISGSSWACCYSPPDSGGLTSECQVADE
jgi:hypothetical protein